MILSWTTYDCIFLLFAIVKFLESDPNICEKIRVSGPLMNGWREVYFTYYLFKWPIWNNVWLNLNKHVSLQMIYFLGDLYEWHSHG